MCVYYSICENGTEECREKKEARVDGGWTDWTKYEACTQTCGDFGEMIRRRTCTNPLPSCNGLSCSGNSSESMPCNRDVECPVTGGWCEWSPYSNCTKECGTGFQSRSRVCECPPPSGGGEVCKGEPVADDQCAMDPCPVDCVVTEWSKWAGCSVTCDTGLEYSSREVLSEPLFGGEECPEPLERDQECVRDTCEEPKCNETSGLDYYCHSMCPSTCAHIRNPDLCNSTGECAFGCHCPQGEVLNEAGECVHPSECGCELEIFIPETGRFTQLLGVDEVYDEHCYTCKCVPFGEGHVAECDYDVYCNEDCEYADWSDWSNCSALCGSGEQSRSREAYFPVTSSGKECDAQYVETLPCKLEECIDKNCTDNRIWSNCSQPCPRTCSAMSSFTACVDVSSDDCIPSCVCKDDMIEQDGECVKPDECRCTVAVSLANGTIVTVMKEPGEQWTDKCNNCTCEAGKEICSHDECEHWSNWSPYSNCSSTCGDGVRTVTRYCVNENKQDEYEGCPGNANKAFECILPECPVECELGEWGDWSNCSKTCGTGSKSRMRFGNATLEECKTLMDTDTQPCGTENCTDVCEQDTEINACSNACNSTCKERSLDSCVEPDECEMGCKCKDDMLLQDGVCVPVSECDCYWDSARFLGATQPTYPNGTKRFRFEDGEEFKFECNTCTCENGLFYCTEDLCAIDCILDDFVLGNCSESCGPGVAVDEAPILQEPSSGGQPCFPINKTRECNLGPCECEDNEVYSVNAGCEHWCSGLNGSPGNANNCLPVEPGCHCVAGTYRDSTGKCVPMEDCGCLVTSSGEIKTVGENWTSSEDECTVCECQLGKYQPICTPKCTEIQVVDDMHHLEKVEGECCLRKVPNTGKFASDEI
ncbi:SCO-spondin-like [Watersipora subatra]|uniref:SCO-spondin-like n=1 Tax=Watersipora subatra TaxID=2589382 RepID=UPI00355BA4E4